jgi:tRNA-dihydrouridine synthase
MIGRNAIGDPNIFSRILNKKEKINFSDYLKLTEKYPQFFRQIKFQAMQFTKGQRNSRKLRNKLVYAKTLEEINELISSS